MISKAFKTNADAIIFDFEDAVRPEQKEKARENLINSRQEINQSHQEVCVRINDLTTDWWRADIEAAISSGVDTLYLPKIENAAQIRKVEKMLTGNPAEELQCIILLETPGGIFNGQSIVGACANYDRFTGISFGIGDYARTIGGNPLSEKVRDFLSLQVTGLAALGGLHPISSTYTEVQDSDGLQRIAEEARDYGFIGLSVIHPSQIPIVNEKFTPTRTEVERARDLLEQFEANDGGAIYTDGVFLDEAMLDRYRRRIQRYEAVQSEK